MLVTPDGWRGKLMLLARSNSRDDLVMRSIGPESFTVGVLLPVKMVQDSLGTRFVQHAIRKSDSNVTGSEL
jgi:hypothetical protein